MKKQYQSKGININLVSALIILVAVAAPWSNTGISDGNFIKSYIGGIGFSLLVLIAQWNNQSKNKTTTLNITLIKTALLSLFILGTLSIFWSVYADFSITKWLIWFTALCAFIVGFHLKIDDQALIKLSWGLLIAAFVIAGIGIVQYLFDFAALSQNAKPASTFGNKNMATQPIVLILPVTLFLMFSSKLSSNKTWIVAVLISLIMAFVFYSRTRSSWLAIIIELVFIIGFFLIKRKELKSWISWNRDKTKASLFGLSMFLLMINLSDQGITPFWEVVTNKTVEVNSDTGASAIERSAQARFLIWNVATNMIKDSPIFGTGLRSWFYNEVQLGFGIGRVDFFLRVHNDVLELGVELGLIGILLFLISIVALVIGSLKIINHDNKTSALFFLFIFIALIGSFVQMQFSFPYQLAVPTLLFGLYAGLISKQSESFIKPLKIIKFNSSKNYNNFTKLFWLVMLIVTSSIYIDWINTYNKITILANNQKFERIKDNMPVIYHFNLPIVFRNIGSHYYKKQNYDATIAIEEVALKYLSNSNHSLYMYGNALLNKGRTKDAFEVAQKLKKIQPLGFYFGQFLELSMYSKTRQSDEYREVFNKLLNEDEKLLAMRRDSYNLLLGYSFYMHEFHKHSVNLYDKHKLYHGYNCTVENKMATYYLTFKKNHKKAKEHVELILNSNNSICLDQKITDELTRHGL